MQPLTRCNNGHYYDAQKHTSCPFCGVQSLELDIQKTMAKKSGGEPELTRAVGGGAAPQDAGKTVGIFRKKLGIDPVVGWLVVVKGTEKGRDYRIVSEKNFIGRAENMDICIAGDESISRENHAIISYNPKNHTFRLFQGDSRGLVYLNDEEVITPEPLKQFDLIELGQTRLMFIPLCGENFKWESETEQP